MLKLDLLTLDWTQVAVKTTGAFPLASLKLEMALQWCVAGSGSDSFQSNGKIFL